MGLHVNGAWLKPVQNGMHLSEKKANQQWPENCFHLPDGGLCPKSHAGAWWQVGVPSALVLCCPFCFTGLATTTAKKGIFHLNQFPAQILSWPCPGTWQARQSRSRWCHCLSSHSATESPWPILCICYSSRLELTVSKWLCRQMLSNSRLMIYLNSYNDKIWKWKNRFPVP